MLFFAYIHARGGLYTAPYRDDRQYQGAKVSRHMSHVTEPFEASGHIEARQKARELIGQHERPIEDARDLFS